uniref:AIPP2-like SPOC-like domain-containing protein n=1 Tax=Leersia perrieri TaxID=77586 RepID=A0A0D9VVD0_9ORYZ
MTFEVPDKWYCCESQRKSNRAPTPSQGGKTTMPNNNTRNRAHQAGSKIPNKFENAKVKFISYEEAALLNNKERPPHSRSNFSTRRTNSQARPASPPSVKQSHSRSDAHAYSQFHRQSSNMEQSPSMSDTQVSFLKRCAGANQNQAEIAGINIKQKAQSGATVPMLRPCSRSGGVDGKIDSEIQNDQREKKALSAHKVTMNHQSQYDPRKKSESISTDTDVGHGSEMSVDNNIDILVVINSSAQYTRRPAPENCWTGRFDVSDGSNCNFADLKAYFPSKVSSKVLNAIKCMPTKLNLEILPRMDDWPKCFETSPPVYEDIGLFFFPAELDW